MTEYNVRRAEERREKMTTIEWARSLRCDVTGWEGDEEIYDMVIDTLAAEVDVLGWLLAEAQWKASLHCADCTAVPCMCS